MTGDQTKTVRETASPAFPFPIEAEANPDQVFNWSDPYTRLGTTASLVWVVVAIIVLLLFSDKANMPPNAWGDLAAGFFSPLAFFWLVLGFFQQGKELRQSSTALMLQVAELKNTVKHQAELAKATADQMEVSRDSLHSTQRAFVYFGKVNARPEYLTNGDGRLTGYVFEMEFSNAGPTPAKDMAVQFEFLSTDGAAPLSLGQFLIDTPRTFPAVLGPNQTLTAHTQAVSVNKLQPIIKKTGRAYLRGFARYTDIFGKHHVTRVCMEVARIIGPFSAANPPKFFYDQLIQGNCADMECATQRKAAFEGAPPDAQEELLAQGWTQPVEDKDWA